MSCKLVDLMVALVCGVCVCGYEVLCRGCNDVAVRGAVIKAVV